MRAALVALAVLFAPVQCPHDTDAAHCWDDAPGDGLWDLANRFHALHDDAAERETLKALVDRYPSSRWAPAARDALAGKPRALAADVAPDVGADAALQ
jgi:hypothetical protein